MQAWIAARLADLDLRLTGSDEPRVRPWSTVQRIETDGGPVWFKANGPGTTYEPGLVETLAELAPGHVLDPLATDAELGWALVPDGGPILRSFDDDVVLSHWPRILPAYAELQRATSDHVGDLVDRGVPDERPQRLPERFSALLDDTDVLLVDRPGGLSRDQLSRPPAGSAELAGLRDAYLEPWADGGRRAELAETVRLATRIHKVARALSWNRALSAVPTDRRGAYGEAVPGWLLELFEPDLL